MATKRKTAAAPKETSETDQENGKKRQPVGDKARVWRWMAGVAGGAGVLFFIWGLVEYAGVPSMSAAPVEQSLSDLEGGKALQDKHLKIGNHTALYSLKIYGYGDKLSGKGDRDQNKPIQYCIYPIISESGSSSTKNAAAVSQKTDNVAVLVKTNRYKMQEDVPNGPKPEKEIRGIVFHRASDLVNEVEFKRVLPNVDPKKVYVLEEGARRPSTTGAWSKLAAAVILLACGAGAFYVQKAPERQTPPPKKAAAKSALPATAGPLQSSFGAAFGQHAEETAADDVTPEAVHEAADDAAHEAGHELEEVIETLPDGASAQPTDPEPVAAGDLPLPQEPVEPATGDAVEASPPQEPTAADVEPPTLLPVVPSTAGEPQEPAAIAAEAPAEPAAPLDPYLAWLGIPPQEQPPDHYRLLGIALYEADAEVIARAAQARTDAVRAQQSGAHEAEAEKIVAEILAAQACLLDATTKAKYDAQLARQKILALLDAGEDAVSAETLRAVHLQFAGGAEKPPATPSSAEQS